MFDSPHSFYNLDCSIDGVISICSRSAVHIFVPSFESPDLFRVHWILLQQTDFTQTNPVPNSPVAKFMQTTASIFFIKSCAITLPGCLYNLYQIILFSNGSLLLFQETNSGSPGTFNFPFGNLIGSGYSVVVDLMSLSGSSFSCFSHILFPDFCLLVTGTGCFVCVWKVSIDQVGQTHTVLFGKFELQQAENGIIDQIVASSTAINSFVVSCFCGHSGYLVNLFFSIDNSLTLNFHQTTDIKLENNGINSVMHYEDGLLLTSNDVSFFLDFNYNDSSSVTVINPNFNSTITGVACCTGLDSILFASLDGSLVMKHVDTNGRNQDQNDFCLKSVSAVSPLYGLACDPLFEIAFFTILKSPDIESTREAQLNYSLNKPSILLSWVDSSEGFDCSKSEDISIALVRIFTVAYKVSSENLSASLFALPMVLSRKFDIWRKFFRSSTMKSLPEKIREGIKITQLADSCVKKKRKTSGLTVDISDDSNSDVDDYKGSNLNSLDDEDNTNFVQATIYNKLSNYLDPSIAQITEVIFGHLLDAVFNMCSGLFDRRDGETSTTDKVDYIMEVPAGKSFTAFCVATLTNSASSSSCSSQISLACERKLGCGKYFT